MHFHMTACFTFYITKKERKKRISLKTQKHCSFKSTRFHTSKNLISFIENNILSMIDNRKARDS